MFKSVPLRRPGGRSELAATSYRSVLTVFEYRYRIVFDQAKSCLVNDCLQIQRNRSLTLAASIPKREFSNLASPNFLYEAIEKLAAGTESIQSATQRASLVTFPLIDRLDHAHAHQAVQRRKG